MRTTARFAVSACVFLSFVSSIALADSYTFSLLPGSGSISGVAGSTIGWGYSITNDSKADWLVTTNLAASAFADGTPDASPFDFPIVAPGATVAVSYDAVAGTGLFALTWDSNAPIGFEDMGDFTLSGQWYSGDPTVTGTFLQNAPDLTAAFSAKVTSSTVTTTVPEPGALLLMPGALGMLLLKRRLDGRCARQLRS